MYREDQFINTKVIHSRVDYAVSLMNGLRNISPTTDLHHKLETLWKISGFESKKSFEQHFFELKGLYPEDYIKKMIRKSKG